MLRERERARAWVLRCGGGEERWALAAGWILAMEVAAGRVTLGIASPISLEIIHAWKNVVFDVATPLAAVNLHKIINTQEV
jgi:hypothetical protein